VRSQSLQISQEDCVRPQSLQISQEDCVRPPVLQSITGGLCAASVTAEHYRRTVCGLSRCRSHRRTVCGLSYCRVLQEDCVRSQSPPLVSRSGRTSGGLRSGWNSCQPVSDFVTFGLIQSAGRPKSKKIGLKAARTKNKKPLEIF